MLTELTSRFRSCSHTLFSAILFFAAEDSLRAAFSVSASVITSPADSGLTRYQYQLTVGANSTFAATDFSVDVAAAAAISSIQSPAGWTANYAVGDDLMYWNAPFNGTADLLPGATANFSFLSALLPAQKAYSTFGVSLVNTDVHLAEGIIAAPSLSPPVGDYNHNGSVDAADYVLWRRTLNQSGANLPADGNSSGNVDQGDYGVWRGSFGQAIASGTEQTSLAVTAVPEPTTPLLLAIATIATIFGRWRHAAK